MRYITVEGLSFQYDAEPVLDNIHYHLDSGEFVTLTGENGAAKSTLIKATLGILKPKKGIVTISDINKDGKKLRMAYLPQQIASFNAGFPSTVYEFVKSGRYPHKGWFRRLNKHDLEHVQRALESVGMWENRYKQIGHLSGGQKQRAVIARIFALDPDIFVLDEPTTGLHFADVHKLVDILARLTEGGNTVIVIEHNLEVIKTADYIIDMGPEGGSGGGTVVAAGTPEEICEVEESYTGQYLKGILNR